MPKLLTHHAPRRFRRSIDECHFCEATLGERTQFNFIGFFFLRGILTLVLLTAVSVDFNGLALLNGLYDFRGIRDSFAQFYHWRSVTSVHRSLS